jgi:hypothetical protein
VSQEDKLDQGDKREEPEPRCECGVVAIVRMALGHPGAEIEYRRPYCFRRHGLDPQTLEPLPGPEEGGDAHKDS